GEPSGDGAEPIAGTGSRSGGSSRSGTGRGSTGSGGTGSGTGSSTQEGEDSSVELMELTLTIWHEDAEEEPLIVLQTLMPPQAKDEKAGSKGSTR
ncbi:MAG: hypothetical protein ACKOSS_06180, partial [Planctomycetia bacterium]